MNASQVFCHSAVHSRAVASTSCPPIPWRKRLTTGGRVPKVFINYRIRDQVGYAALLDRVLTEEFGSETVFRDFRSVHPGDDFVSEIRGNLRSSVALLAIIGPGWARPAGAEQQYDWVHAELAEAFALGVRVIPVLVEDAELPREADLPPDIGPLSRCQAVRIRHSNVEADLDRVVATVAGLLPTSSAMAGGVFRPGQSSVDDDVCLFRVVGSRCRVGIVSGPIRRVRFADAWVNPENTDMEMPRTSEFSVSAIIRYEGAWLDAAGRVLDDVIADELATAVRGRRPVAPGTAIVTGSGRLAESHNVQRIIHVAGVQGEPGAGFRQVRNVGDCVTNALAGADRLTAGGDPIRTILIPVIGVGLGGGAVEATARSLLGAALDYLTATPGSALSKVYFLAYTEAEYAAFGRAVGSSRRMSPVSDHR
jgi:O-acetyl-ADP-ribose deacetylase (regulator of RNase III)